MKLRIKFAKQGPMKFIGHLDIMRYFQKAMRRANIDICYSEGFSPHQIMSFASPLGVGLTSAGEYMDIEVATATSSEQMTEHLNQVMVDGMKVLSVRELKDGAKNAMSIVAAADYSAQFRKEHEPDDVGQYFSRLKEFLDQSQILVIKKGKKGEQEIDIRPFIYELTFRDHTVYMKLSSGSANNLKPELVLEAYAHFCNAEYKGIAYQIQREELYAVNNADPDHPFISLEELGEEFE